MIRLEYFYSISIVVFFCSYASVVQSKAAKMLSLSPLKCTGKVSVKSNNMADRSTSSSSPLSSSSSPPASYDTVFLCKSGRLEFIDDNKANPTGDVVTICDVVPLVLDYNPLLKEGTQLVFVFLFTRRSFFVYVLEGFSMLWIINKY